MTNADGLCFEIVRRFHVSPPVVFDAWLNCETMRRWMFVIATNEIEKVEVEEWVGGRFSILERNQGEYIDHFGEYEVINRPSLLTFTLTVPKHFSGTTRISVKIREVDSGSEMIFTQRGVPKEITEPNWLHMFETLKAVVEDEK